MISTKTRIQERLSTLKAYVPDFQESEVEDVTCENFMTEREGTHSVLLRDVTYDWDGESERFAPRK